MADLLRERLRCTPMGAVLRFGGDSETTTTNWQQDNRRVIGEQGVSAENSTINYTVNDVSGPIVDRAITTGGLVAGRALDNMTTVNANSLTFADRTVVNMVDLASEAMATAYQSAGLVAGAAAGALDFGSDVFSGALSSNNAMAARAFDASTDAFALGLNATGNMAARAFDATGDAYAGALNATRDAFTGALDFSTDTLGTAADFYQDTRDFGQSTLAQGFAAMNKTGDMVAAAFNDAKGRGSMTDKLILGAVIAMAVVAFMAVQKK